MTCYGPKPRGHILDDVVCQRVHCILTHWTVLVNLAADLVRSGQRSDDMNRIMGNIGFSLNRRAEEIATAHMCTLLSM